MMNNIYEDYELVVGLEVHAQLATASKAFSSDEATYGANPNTLVSPISLGHPGTLPVLNKSVLEFAIKLGISTNCEIRPWNEFARKNYFYADLPKGYQITQHTTPICFNGWVETKDDAGKTKRIGITRIHIEEDAGKSIHDMDAYDSLVDLNRCGVPLLEIVSEPDIRSSKEAYNYLTEIRKLVRYLEICDGNMEEGSLRCDANISVRKRGASEFGTKIEVKNMNSIRNVQRAIEFEFQRQIELLESGHKLSSETRSFDAVNGTTFSLRSKEQANDYRYFPEPDLQPVVIDKAYIDEVRSMMPPLPNFLLNKFQDEYKLSSYDAQVLTDSKEYALFFEEVVKHNPNYKAVANWIMGPVKSVLNSEAKEMKELNLSASRLSELIKLVDENVISNSAATQRVFPELLISNESPLEIAKRLNVVQDSNEDNLKEKAKSILLQYPEKVEEYRSGKKGVLGLFMGELMKVTQGKADPKLANKIFVELIEN